MQLTYYVHHHESDPVLNYVAYSLEEIRERHKIAPQFREKYPGPVLKLVIKDEDEVKALILALLERQHYSSTTPGKRPWPESDPKRYQEIDRARVVESSEVTGVWKLFPF